MDEEKHSMITEFLVFDNSAETTHADKIEAAYQDIFDSGLEQLLVDIECHRGCSKFQADELLAVEVAFVLHIAELQAFVQDDDFYWDACLSVYDGTLPWHTSVNLETATEFLRRYAMSQKTLEANLEQIFERGKLISREEALDRYQMTFNTKYRSEQSMRRAVQADIKIFDDFKKNLASRCLGIDEANGKVRTYVDITTGMECDESPVDAVEHY